MEERNYPRPFSSLNRIEQVGRIGFIVSVIGATACDLAGGDSHVGLETSASGMVVSAALAGVGYLKDVFGRRRSLRDARDLHQANTREDAIRLSDLE